MKESNPSWLTKPKFRNKAFATWTKAELCKKEDNIISNDWREILKRTVPFVPVYDNKPVNMVYLMSGEYGRLWMKQRDEWYANVFVPTAKEQDMINRKNRIIQKAKEEKKAAQKSARERKERKAKEKEEKAKADAEKLEKLKAKVRKAVTKPSATLPKKKPVKVSETKKKKKLPKEKVQEETRCECSDHDKKEETEGKTEETKQEPESEQDSSNQECMMCQRYIKQLQELQEAQVKANEKEETNEPAPDQTKGCGDFNANSKHKEIAVEDVTF